MSKRMMIESQSSGGKCYLRLLTSVPAYKTCKLMDLEHAIVEMTLSLGSNPLGTDVLTELWYANMRMAGKEIDPDVSHLHLANSASNFSSRMFSSGCRYTWEEIGGVFHIGGFIENDNCNDIYCEHGWKSKFVLCAMTNNGAKIGAEDSLSQFMDSWQPSVLKCDDLRNELEGVIDELDQARSLNHDMITALNVTKQRTGMAGSETDLRFRGVKDDDNWNKLDDSDCSDSTPTVKEISKPKAPKFSKVKNDPVSEALLENLKKQEKDEMESLLPCDSSSQFQRYKKKYLNPGTIYDIDGRGKTQLSILLNDDDDATTLNNSPVASSVILGYKKTENMHKLELKSTAKVSPINGLSNPFRSDRLNLLMHFHTAIDNLSPKTNEMSHYDALHYLTTFKSVTPSEELAHQVIIRTFDLTTNRVIANPFKLPFLEVGMHISDDSLSKSLDFFRLEFKMLWFDQVKSLTIPSFHCEYKNRHESRITTKKKETYDKQHKQKSNKKTSILGFVS